MCTQYKSEEKAFKLAIRICLFVCVCTCNMFVQYICLKVQSTQGQRNEKWLHSLSMFDYIWKQDEKERICLPFTDLNSTT